MQGFVPPLPRISAKFAELTLRCGRLRSKRRALFTAMTFLATALANVHAQCAKAQTYSSPVYSSTGGATWAGKSFPYSLNVYPFGANDMGGGGPDGCVCAGAINAVFQWNQGTQKATAPANVIIEEQAYASWTSQLSGRCDDGLKDGERNTSSLGPPFPLNQGVSSGTHYVSVQPGAGGNITVSCTPTASADNVGPSQAEVAFSASIVPVTISLSGVTNVQGAPEILPGQMCSATLNVPSGFTCTSCKWTIGGTYYSSWTPGQPPTPVNSSLLTWPNATYPATGAPVTPEWYWEDTTASKTEHVSCIATFTAPDGATVTASAITKVTEEVPGWTGTSHASNMNIIDPGTPGLWANPLPVGPSYKGGFELDYSVNLPQGFAFGGFCQYAQLVSVNLTKTPGGAFSAAGLDLAFPYPYLGAGIPDNNLVLVDFPGTSVSGFTAVSCTMKMQDYCMFLPGGINSQWVPLHITNWGWSCNANEPPGGWKAGIAGVTGSVTVGTDAPTATYPQWVSTIQSQEH